MWVCRHVGLLKRARPDMYSMRAAVDLVGAVDRCVGAVKRCGEEEEAFML